MKTNPVYRREATVSARSFRLPLVLMIFNGILALVALLNMYSTLLQVQLTAEIQYSSFLDLYLFVAVLEFVMVLFIMPALTAGSISGEREHRTLEIMLTTRLTPGQIVAGKMMNALSTITLMIVSSLPMLALVFVYGGVTVIELVMVVVSYFAAALYIGSLGICCSALSEHSTYATVAAYLMTAFAVVGTFGINGFAAYMTRMRGEAALSVYTAAAAMGLGGSGKLVYLLLLNPTTSFLMLMLRLTGQDPARLGFDRLVGTSMLHTFDQGWIFGSVLIQILLAAIFLQIAVKALTPGRK